MTPFTDQKVKVCRSTFEVCQMHIVSVGHDFSLEPHFNKLSGAMISCFSKLEVKVYWSLACNLK